MPVRAKREKKRSGEIDRLAKLLVAVDTMDELIRLDFSIESAKHYSKVRAKFLTLFFNLFERIDYGTENGSTTSRREVMEEVEISVQEARTKARPYHFGTDQ